MSHVDLYLDLESRSLIGHSRRVSCILIMNTWDMNTLSMFNYELFCFVNLLSNSVNQEQFKYIIYQIGTYRSTAQCAERTLVTKLERSIKVILCCEWNHQDLSEKTQIMKNQCMSSRGTVLSQILNMLKPHVHTLFDAE